MNITEVCPGCKVRLVIRDRVRTPFITCPRCLTAVKNPHLAAGAPAGAPPVHGGAPPSAASGPSPRQGVPVGVPVCSVCAELLPNHSNNCPASPRQREQPAWSAPAADREADSDSNGTFVAAIILSVFILLGVVSVAGFGGGAAMSVVLGFAILSGGKKGALASVATVMTSIFLMSLVFAGLAIVAVLVMCSGMKFH